MSIKYATIDALSLREMYRKEKGKAEYQRMLDRYDEECGECITFKNEDELNAYYEIKNCVTKSKIPEMNNTQVLCSCLGLVEDFKQKIINKIESIEDFND